MNKKFGKVLSTALAACMTLTSLGSAFPTAAFAESADESAATAASSRTEVSLNGEWSFTDPDVEGTQTVTVPSSWDNFKSANNLYANVKTCSYEKAVDVSAYQGKRIQLKFEGVNKTANVYVDGELVGTHVGGFTTFYMDITNACQGKSSVTVKVDVTNMDFNTMPVNSDFTHFGGIYRDVALVVTDPVASISNDDYGSDGVYFNTGVDLENGTATLDTTVMVNYDHEAASVYDTIDLEAIVTLRDAEGNVVAEGKSDAASVQGDDSAYEVTIPTMEVENAHLWNGTIDPYLYTAEVELQVNGETVDTNSQRIGFRTYEVKDGKFYLNGSLYELRGVGMHQEYGEITNATSDAQKAEDIALVLEMGANALRTCHYPHDQYIYDLCDENGIVVWNEIPFYLIMLDTEAFKENAMQSAMEMVKQGYNHPSIIVWGIQNEVNVYSSYSKYYPTQATPEQLGAFIQEMAQKVHETDPSRLVGEAEIDNTNYSKETAGWTTDDSGIDVVGFNIYTGWYSNVNGATTTNQTDRIVNSFKSKLGTYQQRFTESSEHTSYVLTEYGAGANVEQHDALGEDFKWGGTDSSKGYTAGGQYHPEEYQSYVHEGMMMAIYGDETNNIEPAEDLWAAFAWSMFDFSCYRNEGSTTRRNTKGLVTSDRQTKKDAFYLYKANWNDSDPFTYITSKRYTNRDAESMDVKVYSNCDSVALSVNGAAAVEGTKQQDGVFVWSDVSLAEIGGETKVEVVGYKDGQQVATDSAVFATGEKTVIESEDKLELPYTGTAAADPEFIVKLLGHDASETDVTEALLNGGFITTQWNKVVENGSGYPDYGYPDYGYPDYGYPDYGDGSDKTIAVDSAIEPGRYIFVINVAAGKDDAHTWSASQKQIEVVIEGAKKTQDDFRFTESNIVKTVGDENFTVTTENGVGDITYTSSNEEVATVDNNGLVTIVSVGTTTITAVAAGDDEYQSATATCTLTVKEAAAAEKKPQSNFHFTESNIVKTVGDKPFAVSTENGVGEITYTSSNEEVATVDNNGLVTIVGVGETTITANAAGDDEYLPGTATCALTVKEAVAAEKKAQENFRFTESNIVKTVGDEAFAVSTENGVGEITYTSSNEEVATIDSEGKVTIVGVGEATITATAAGDDEYLPGTATCALTVKEAAAEKKAQADFRFTKSNIVKTVGDEAFTVSTENGVGEITYTSSNEEVATIDSEGNVTIVGVGTTTITAVAAGDDEYLPGTATCTLTVKEAAAAEKKPQSNFRFTESSISKDLDDEPFTVTTENSVGEITYTSSNADVATIDGEGKVTIVGVGETTITAVAAGDDEYLPGTATCKLTVTFEKMVQADFRFASQNIVKDLQHDDKTFTLTAENGVGEITYTSSNEEVATVDNNGVVTIVGAGTTTITAKAAGSDRYLPAETTCSLTVTTRIPQSDFAFMNGGADITMFLGDEDIANLATGAKTNVTYSSSNPEVVTVSENGMIHAVSVGTAVITASAAESDVYMAAELQYTVTVKEVTVTSVTLNAHSAAMYVGDERILRATAAPENAANKALVWSSSDNSIAVVDENGKVTAKAVGEAEIMVCSAANPEIASKCKVTVSALPEFKAETENKTEAEKNAAAAAIPTIRQILENIQSFNGKFGTPGNSTITKAMNDPLAYIRVIPLGIEATLVDGVPVVTRITFDVTPYTGDGEPMHGTFSSSMEFKLPVGDVGFKYGDVYHEGKFLTQCRINNGVITVRNNTFSEYSVELTNVERKGSSSSSAAPAVSTETKYYSMTAVAHGAGTLSSTGVYGVKEGSDFYYDIAPDAGRSVLRVLVDGVDVGAVRGYTFENIHENHVIEVFFSGADKNGATGTAGRANPQTGIYE